MKKWVITITVIAIILSLATCKKPEPKKEYIKTVFVLIDYSESARNARQDYIDSFKKILSKIKLGDRLFIWKITDISEMEMKPLVDEDFPFPSPAKNEFYSKQAYAKAESEMKAKLQEIEKMMQALLSSEDQLSIRTSILGSLQVAERVFKNDKRDKAVLVIMSDMIEDSSEYNFEKEDLSQKRTDEIIARQKQRRRMPDLNGVNVYVGGARASAREQFYNIQNFWLRYFKECGADLSKERYGSALLSFNE